MTPFLGNNLFATDLFLSLKIECEYRPRSQVLRVKLLDDTVKHVVVNFSKPTQEVVETIAEKLGLPNGEEYGYARIMVLMCACLSSACACACAYAGVRMQLWTIR